MFRVVQSVLLELEMCLELFRVLCQSLTCVLGV